MIAPNFTEVHIMIIIPVKVSIDFLPTGIPDICHFFTQAKFLENKIYTEKTRKLRQNTQ